LELAEDIHHWDETSKLDEHFQQEHRCSKDRRYFQYHCAVKEAFVL
jgi:hypothetical protein